MIEEKICTKCKKVKPLSCFYKRTDRNCLFAECKDCANKRPRRVNKELKKISGAKWKSENRERVRNNQRKWRESNIESARQSAREWSRKNRQYISQKYMEWKNKNREKVNEYARKWASRHPEISSASRRNRRARLKGNGGKISSGEWKDLCDKYDNKCLCCGRKDIEITLDHVLPLKLGGRNEIENSQPLCRSCNSKKKDKFIDYRPSHP